MLRCFAISSAFALCFVACKPIAITTTPDAAGDYQGVWTGSWVELRLTPGKPLSSSASLAPTVMYRHKWGLTQCEWKGLAGRDIVYRCSRGSGKLIRVDVAPHRDGSVWKMTVEGVEVTRK